MISTRIMLLCASTIAISLCQFVILAQVQSSPPGMSHRPSLLQMPPPELLLLELLLLLVELLLPLLLLEELLLLLLLLLLLGVSALGGRLGRGSENDAETDGGVEGGPGRVRPHGDLRV